MFLAEPVVSAFLIDADTLMHGHNFSEMVLQLMILVSVDVTLLTKVGVIILAEPSGLTAT